MKANEYKYYLFDLDGTLTDSCPGILRCVQYALKQYGIEENDLNQLRKFCGPPLVDSFKGFYHFSQEDAEKATAYYRQEYLAGGIFENEVYEGIPELLRDLKAEGKYVLVATSKPETMAQNILEHFDLARYFDVITGAGMDTNVRHSKADVIRETLVRMGVREDEMDHVLMIGDRRYDVLGALECGLDCVGVYYGYADPGELEAAGAKFTVDTVQELRNILLNK